jgi:hypothetical protein
MVRLTDPPPSLGHGHGLLILPHSLPIFPMPFSCHRTSIVPAHRNPYSILPARQPGHALRPAGGVPLGMPSQAATYFAPSSQAPVPGPVFFAHAPVAPVRYPTQHAAMRPASHFPGPQGSQGMPAPSQLFLQHPQPQALPLDAWGQVALPPGQSGPGNRYSISHHHQQ